MQDHGIIVYFVTRAENEGDGLRACEVANVVQSVGLVCKFYSVAVLELCPARRVVTEPFAQFGTRGDLRIHPAGPALSGR